MHLRPLLVCALLGAAGAAFAQADPPATGVLDNMPVFAPALKGKLGFPMAWTAQVRDLPAWRAAGRAKVWELSLQGADTAPFAPRVLAEIDRGSYVARKVAFNLTADSRVLGLLLVPKGKGPFPAALMLHDHGARFDIGKEKLIEPWGDEARLASARAWSKKYFSGRFPGDALAQRGYVVLAVDALGWGDRGPLTAESQQALAANSFNLGSSLAGIMALEDTRAADFLAAQPEVARGKVAAVGFSMGGFRAWQVAALSDAISAFVVVNWMATTDGLMVAGNNQLKGGSAWHMLHPGLLRYLDFPDVASLAAPKPALFFAGEQDGLFPAASAQAAFARMGKVWAAWKAADRFEARMLPGGHEFTQPAQDAAYDWLDRQGQRAR
ncbi:dienelactone hydrolase family protein [Massilia sp. DWR3-1-1]|uniref:dienelactone hydrolase family protein n=1 Tax=Massilia sp. DWR3-1-1 TaxID=2804559 RepID=UPI003CEA6418